MARIVKPIRYEEQLSIVEHLDELRNRLVVSLCAFAAVFAVCLWQDDRLIEILNRPLQQIKNDDRSAGIEGDLKRQTELRKALEQTSKALTEVANGRVGRSDQSAENELKEAATALNKAAELMVQAPPPRQPVTLGVGEPFSTTLSISGAFALIITLPLLIYQLYAFLVPALTKRERNLALPVTLAVPFLFFAGALFGYFMIVPPAIAFLQGFNDSSFDILIQARDYYRFELMAIGAMGVLFQIPLAIIAVTRLGIVTPKQLRKNRRYAILVIAVVAMLLPGTDPVTMIIAMLPLLVLYELSILLAVWLDRRADSKEPDSAF